MGLDLQDKKTQRTAIMAGKALAEGMRDLGQEQVLKESFGITFKEDQTTQNNDGSFVTVLSSTIYHAVISEKHVQAHLSLVEINDDLIGMQGAGALQLPIEQPTIAVEVSEGRVFKRFDEGTDEVIAKPRKVIAGTVITREIAKRGLNAIKRNLNKSVQAIGRRLATDIVEGLAAGAAAGNTQTGGITVDAIIDATVAVHNASYSETGVKYGFTPDKLVIAAGSYGVISKSTDWQQYTYRGFAQPGQNTLNYQPDYFGHGSGVELEIMVSQFLVGAQALVLDSKEAATLVKEIELETYEEPVDGRPYDTQVVGLMSYVVIVKYPDAIARITA